jgi:hypothetical protein
LKVDCRAVNDFGYIATATGNLQFTSRPQPNQLATSGSLTINTHLFGDPNNVRTITVQGTTDLFGQYAQADVLSGALDLVSVFFAYLPNGGSSHIDDSNTTQFQTECATSIFTKPPIADLMLTGALHFSTLTDGTQSAQVDVVNAGNTKIVGTSNVIRIQGKNYTGSLTGSFLGRG